MSVEAIVLAGGRSTRFGRDKLAEDLDGGTVLAATIAAVSAVADIVIVVGPALPDGSGAGATHVIHLPDPEPFGGPLVALATALDRRVVRDPRELAILVGGDMPRLVPAVLAAMLGLLDGDAAIEAVVLQAPEATRRQVLPLAVRRENAAAAARAAIESGQRSLLALVERLAVVELPSATWRALDPAGNTLVDVDTPDDLDRLRSAPNVRRGNPGTPGQP